MSDPTIERIEADLRESQFKPWDAETFLAGRHQAKIEALSEPESVPTRLWVVAKELGAMFFAYIGQITVAAIIAIWLLTGEVPIHRLFEP